MEFYKSKYTAKGSSLSSLNYLFGYQGSEKFIQKLEKNWVTKSPSKTREEKENSCIFAQNLFNKEYEL